VVDMYKHFGGTFGLLFQSRRERGEEIWRRRRHVTPSSGKTQETEAYPAERLTQELSSREHCLRLKGPGNSLFYVLRQDGDQANLRNIMKKGKVVPVLNLSSSTPWRRMGEWMYRSTISWRRH
jgi:hypothetical protein